MNKIRISDIAKCAGVSNATVSRALNNKSLVNSQTYNKIVEAINNLGCTYLLGRNTSVRSENGLIVISLPTISNPFYSDITKGIKSAAQRYGYSVLISDSYLDEQGLNQLLDLIKNNNISGVITANCLDSQSLDKLSSLTNVVQCCEFCEGYDAPYVSIDDYQAIKEALDYLLSRGRKKIAFINGPQHFKYSRYRKASYLDFLKEHELPIKEDWIIQLPEIDYTMALAAITQTLSKAYLPDAIITISDVYASAAIRAAKNNNISVPDDLMVIGFDNIDISSMSDPTITTINQPKMQLGYMACELMVEKIQNPSVKSKQIVLGTELILRESTS